MSDHTSDDLLNQPEPETEDGAAPLKDDPVVDIDAANSLAAHFARQKELQQTPTPGAPPASKASPSDPEKASSMLGSPTDAAQLDKSTALRVELQQVKRELALLKMAPAERYPEVLKDAEISEEEAYQILDCVIVQLRPWEEHVKVSKNLTLVFRTRTHRNQRRLEDWAEKTRPQLDTTVVAEAIRNNIAASLVSYGDIVFDGEDEEERFQKVYDFLDTLPDPAYRLLQQKLAWFDAKINAVFSEGYLENF